MSAKSTSRRKRAPSRRKGRKKPPQRFTWLRARWQRWQKSRASAKTARRPARKTPPAPAAAAPRLSLDRKLDVTGILLALGGALTLLSLFSGEGGALSSAWAGLLRRLLGWGAFLFPLALLGVGLWLILREFERVPWPAPERVIGALLGFANLLVWFQFIVWPASSAAGFAVARAGHGGGYLGAAALELMRAALGGGGTFIVLSAWLLMALTLLLDRPVVTLFAWTSPLGRSLRRRWERYRPRGWLPPWKRKPPPRWRRNG